jgi:hypothetical protein
MTLLLGTLTRIAVHGAQRDFVDGDPAEIRPVAKLTLAFLSLSALFLTGCFTLGPRTVARARFDCSTAISESWKRQTLLNLIKIRYADVPVFLDVTSIINQYALDSLPPSPPPQI